MKWLGGKVNPLSIDSGSKEEINKSLSKYVLLFKRISLVFN